ncbi:hypothetical protein LEM8419_01015 [Neolewinella maritima]|uniref:Uncharacterized protein n=1 Tax=Neolewinella maritima TaxID=1383882 RepID=A0ABN8F4M2_9BACT|nr:hypothetical protein [Neolewinella maritima]CAH0999715.1 hypothetical protein LEM8419_01015 [Neolewinella maritima]
MYYRLVFVFLLLASSLCSWGQAGTLARKDQQALQEAELRMAILVETVYTDSSAEVRFQACRDLIRELVTALDRPNSFAYPFDQLPGLSIQYAPDRSFRIFSWELMVDRDGYRHYGAVQKNSKQLELEALVDRGDGWLKNPENAVVGASNWLGYVVYTIVAGGTYDGRSYYFVLGYDSYEAYRRRKVLDVLHFDEAGKAVFGLPVFHTYTDSDLLLLDRARMIMVYGAEATMALRYDAELGGIVYENLLMVPGNYGEGPVNMPDGSYNLLVLGEDGMWRENAQVFTHTYEEAPREVPLPGGGRDLLGRPDSSRVKDGGGDK